MDIGSNSESFLPVWLRIKKVSTDKTVHLIELLPWEPITRNLLNHCRPMRPTCPYLHDLEERAAAANAVLARHRWRVFPCYRDTNTTGPERLGAGCEHFQDLEVSFQKPRLRIALEGRVLLDAPRPSWVDRSPTCPDDIMRTDIESMAYDPETGTLLLLAIFTATSEGCNTSIWEIHPLHLPLVGR